MKTSDNLALDYARKVRKNPELYPRKIILAVDRFYRWLRRDDIWWDNEKAEAGIWFIEHNVRHVKGDLAGQLIKLEPWQIFGFAQLFGWQRRDDKGRDVRVIREVYWQVPKKNGKTLIAVGGLTYAMYSGEELGADCYCVASDYDQAQYAAGPFAEAVKKSPALYSRSKIYLGKANTVKGVTYKYTVDGMPFENKMIVQTKNAAKIEGSNPYFVLNDELHAQENMDQYDNFKSAQVERAQPIMFNISTAGKGSSSVGMRVYKECTDVLMNDDDDSRLVLIYEPNKGYDWTDEAVWRMVNPNVDVSITMDALRMEFNQAKRSAQGKATFLSKHLDVFVNSNDTYFDQNEVESILRPDEMGDLNGEQAWLGLDLSKTTDLTCVSLNFPTYNDNGKAILKVKQRYFIPYENIEYRERQDNVPYQELSERGFVEFCDGKMIDQDQILNYIRDLMGKYDIQQLNYDPAMAQRLIEQCENLGLDCVSVPQYPSVMNNVVDDIERLIYEKRLITDNPLLVYCLANMTVITNVGGLKSPSKKYSKKKIDGAAAMMIGHKATIDQMDDIDADALDDYIDDLYD
jgi:phage terminase large subunit-like protein